RAGHPVHCLGVLRIFLTASPLPPALSHHDGQGAQGLHSGKLATSSDKSLTTRRARFYQAYLPETAPPQQTAYHSIVPPYVCTDPRLPRSHLGTMLSLLGLFVVFSKLFVVCPHDNCTNLATYDRCFTIAMNSGSIAYKPAMIGSGSSR